MGQPRAIHQGLRHNRHVRGRQTERTHLVLVEVDAQRADRLIPVELHIPHLRICRNHALDIACNRAHDLSVGPDDAELHGEAHGRTELQARDPQPGLRKCLVDHGHQARAHALARFEITGHYDELGVTRVRQLGVEG